MSWLLARIYDQFMSESEVHGLAGWRAELLSDVSGHVLELGAGTGANLPFYKAEQVESLILTEPNRHMRAKLVDALAGHKGPQTTVLVDSAESLKVPNASVDVVVSTLVLCSVGSLETALSEIRRVLRPGGCLLFIEHVAADDRPERLRWQERLEPLWRRMAGNCHLTRRTHHSLVDAGFTLQTLERASMRKALPICRPSIRGVAVRR